jgi:hypothetical protein
MFSFVTIGFKSVPFLLFLLPLPLAAAEATLAICFPLLITAFLMSPPFIIPRMSRGCAWEGGVVGKTGSASTIYSIYLIQTRLRFPVFNRTVERDDARQNNRRAESDFIVSSMLLSTVVSVSDGVVMVVRLEAPAATCKLLGFGGVPWKLELFFRRRRIQSAWYGRSI